MFPGGITIRTMVPTCRNGLRTSAMRRKCIRFQAGDSPMLQPLLAHLAEDIPESSDLLESDHPPKSICHGEGWSVYQINAIMQSSAWPTTAIFVTWDDFGGFYDHVVPASEIKPDNIAPLFQTGDQPGDFAHSGFRLPIIVISPWVKPNYVSHVWRDITSILRLIEVRFKVPALSARDASADDMMEFFDFSRPYWLTPPILPVQPISGTCDYNKEKAPGF